MAHVTPHIRDITYFIFHPQGSTHVYISLSFIGGVSTLFTSLTSKFYELTNMSRTRGACGFRRGAVCKDSVLFGPDRCHLDLGNHRSFPPRFLGGVPCNGYPFSQKKKGGGKIRISKSQHGKTPEKINGSSSDEISEFGAQKTYFSELLGLGRRMSSNR